jgi:hypothetical protein
MPPRTYDFSGYQGGAEALIGGVGKGFSAMENVRQSRKREQQGDEAFKLQLQQILDQINRERIKAGASPIDSPLGAAAQGRPSVQPTPGFNPNVQVPGQAVPLGGARGPITDGSSPMLDTGGATMVQGAPNAVVGRLRSTIGGMLERFGGGHRTPDLATLTKTGPSENEALLGQRHDQTLTEGAFEHGNRMELERLQQDRQDSRLRLELGQRGRESELRAGIDGRNSLIYEINLRNAEINDLQQQAQAAEQAKKNLNVMQFGGDMKAMQDAATQLDAQIADYNRRIQGSMQSRNGLMRRLSGQSAPEALPTPAPHSGASRNGDPVSTLRRQADEAIAAGADRNAVEQRFRQAFSQMVGQALGDTNKDRGFGHR